MAGRMFIRILYVIFGFLSLNAMALSMSVNVCLKDGTCSRQSPNYVYTNRTNINYIEFTLNSIGSSYYYTETSGWYLTFGGNSGFVCKQSNGCDSATLSIISAQASGSTNNYTYNVVFRMTAASSGLPSAFTNQLNAQTSVAVSPNYTDPNGQNNTSGGSVNWQEDTGVFLYGPNIKVAPRFKGFSVGLSAPSDTYSVEKNSSNVLVKSTNDSVISGYVLMYWLQQYSTGGAGPCGGNFTNVFAVNTVSYGATAATITGGCTTPAYSNSIGGTTDSISGCTTGGGAFLTNPVSGSTLTYNQAIYPDLSQIGGLSVLTSNPSYEYQLGNTCVNVVYVSADQSSWVKADIENGDIYGVIAWAVNSASSPNVSFYH